MLLLVLGDNYVLLYIGWEGVGLASYLLIGVLAAQAQRGDRGKKAFIMNRVGDAGLAIAIFMMFATFGTVDFGEVFRRRRRRRPRARSPRSACCCCSAPAASPAQFPLQSWLPDAMEGPTPVSALIHAATMVTAGVYLIARSSPIFDAAPTAQLVVTIVGAVTLLVGAIIGCAKDDIKRALACSTMSQIGYMFLAAGLGRSATPWPSCTCWRTASSRPTCSSAPARSCTA